MADFWSSGRHFCLDIWQNSVDYSAGTVNVGYHLYINNGGGTWYDSYLAASIDGQQIYNSGAVSWSTGSFPAADGEVWGSVNVNTRSRSSISCYIEGYSEVYSTSSASSSLSVTRTTAYTISYNANGGSSTPSSQTKYYNKDLTLRPAISRNKSTTSNYYTVTFNGNGGTSKSSSLGSTRTISYSFSDWSGYSAEGTYTSNSSATLYANWSSSTSYSSISLPSASRTGYEFLGWYTKASGGSKIGSAGTSYTPSSSLTLYAHWKALNSEISDMSPSMTFGTNYVLGSGFSLTFIPHSSSYYYKIYFNGSGYNLGYYKGTIEQVVSFDDSNWSETTASSNIASTSLEDIFSSTNTSANVPVYIATYSDSGYSTLLGTSSVKYCTITLPAVSPYLPVINSASISDISSASVGGFSSYLKGHCLIGGISQLGYSIERSEYDSKNTATIQKVTIDEYLASNISSTIEYSLKDSSSYTNTSGYGTSISINESSALSAALSLELRKRNIYLTDSRGFTSQVYSLYTVKQVSNLPSISNFTVNVISATSATIEVGFKYQKFYKYNSVNDAVYFTSEDASKTFFTQVNSGSAYEISQTGSTLDIKRENSIIFTYNDIALIENNPVTYLDEGAESLTSKTVKYTAILTDVLGQSVTYEANSSIVCISRAYDPVNKKSGVSFFENASESDIGLVNIHGELNVTDVTTFNEVTKVKSSSDIPEGSGNLADVAEAHTMKSYRNGLLIPNQSDNSDDGSIIRCKGTSENNTIFELGTWGDPESDEEIQFNYYPTTSRDTPTYSVAVPKKTGTMLLKEELLNLIYPIGSIYMSTTNTSPGSFLGGTWEQIKDTFLLSSGSTYTAGNTGGAATHKTTGSVGSHTLTTDEIPAHTHGSRGSSNNLYAYSWSDGASGGGVSKSTSAKNMSMSAGSDIGYIEYSWSNSHTHSSVGGGNGHNHGFTGANMDTMPPYLVVYMWKRTA